MATWYQWQGGDLILTVRVQPRAARDEVVGPHGDSLKVRITAPPVDGKANEHLVKFLAKCFGVSRAAVTLLSGETGREKRLRIESPSILPPMSGIAPSLSPPGAAR